MGKRIGTDTLAFVKKDGRISIPDVVVNAAGLKYGEFVVFEAKKGYIKLFRAKVKKS